MDIGESMSDIESMKGGNGIVEEILLLVSLMVVEKHSKMHHIHHMQ